MTRYDTITVTLEEPLNDEYVESLCDAIKHFDGVNGADPGHIDPLEKVAAKRELRQQMWNLLEEGGSRKR